MLSPFKVSVYPERKRNEITYPQPSPGAPPGWRFPDGTVVVNFSNGNNQAVGQLALANFVNLQGPIGNLTSPLFGESNALAGNGPGGSTPANRSGRC